MKYMLDTNICIYAMKKNMPLLQKLLAKDPADMCISSIALSELLFGIEKSKKKESNKQILLSFLSNLTILNYDENAALEYATLRNNLENSGTPIGAMDMLIAAHALSKNLVLITNNEKEFQRVQGLKIENWTI